MSEIPDSPESASQLARARALNLAESVKREVGQADPDWGQVGQLARSLADLARAEGAAWKRGTEKLRGFATSVFIECCEHLERKPRCLPVLGAGGDAGQVTLRGLLAGESGTTREWAEECFATQMFDLFAKEGPACGAIAFRTLRVPDEDELLVVVAFEGQSGEAACFVGPVPSANPDWPHLVAEDPLPRHAERVEALEALFAGERPHIHFGDREYWQTWLARAKAGAPGR